MKSLLRRFQRIPSPKTFRESGSATASEDSPPYPIERQSRFSRSSRVVNKLFVPMENPVCKSPVESSRSRKRDRLKDYLSRRRSNKSKGSLPYLWPAMLSADKEELRSSDDTEEGDDVYMVDFQSDSDSEEDSLSEDDYTMPPVAIPEMYRRQDRLGGITVAGARVLFTYAGFKRQQMLVGKLQAVPESAELVVPVGVHREYIVIAAY
ncbi:unnamed protein product [Phytophthora lilii]|uniref:Unnamed protein product n=1 Tax=Phytophthora lilii TaxID=2077276 RepID=A0A9W6TB55_9STRA|nr:unnamed protein product [Phytophthora lilii]